MSLVIVTNIDSPLLLRCLRSGASGDAVVCDVHGETVVRASSYGETVVRASSRGKTVVRASSHGETVVRALSHGETVVRASSHGGTVVRASSHRRNRRPRIVARRNRRPRVVARQNRRLRIVARRNRRPRIVARNRRLRVVARRNSRLRVRARRSRRPRFVSWRNGRAAVRPVEVGVSSSSISFRCFFNRQLSAFSSLHSPSLAAHHCCSPFPPEILATGVQVPPQVQPLGLQFVTRPPPVAPPLSRLANAVPSLALSPFIPSLPTDQLCVCALQVEGRGRGQHQGRQHCQSLHQGRVSGMREGQTTGARAGHRASLVSSPPSCLQPAEGREHWSKGGQRHPSFDPPTPFSTLHFPAA
ncbi:unnamed protein product [Closterium sp. NIES-65]|nr:unnamed protein product [Closterium sp. NIES-65]